MAQLAFAPAHKNGSQREIYQVYRFSERFILYMIDREAQSHTLVWNGRINLGDLLDWDERLVDLTRPESKHRTRRHGRQCVADLELVTRAGAEEAYHIEFDNDEYKTVKGFTRTHLHRAEINHVPFDLCAMNGNDDDSSSISVGMHDYRPFPMMVFDMYDATTVADFRPLRPQRRTILEKICLLANP